jgi:hypothetical protein
VVDAVPGGGRAEGLLAAAQGARGVHAARALRGARAWRRPPRWLHDWARVPPSHPAPHPEQAGRRVGKRQAGLGARLRRHTSPCRSVAQGARLEAGAPAWHSDVVLPMRPPRQLCPGHGAPSLAILTALVTLVVQAGAGAPCAGAGTRERTGSLAPGSAPRGQGARRLEPQGEGCIYGVGFRARTAHRAQGAPRRTRTRATCASGRSTR